MHKYKNLIIAIRLQSIKDLIQEMSNLPKGIIPLTSQQFQAKYKILQDVDHGTYGVVFKCINISTSQMVAVKELKDNTSLTTVISQMNTMKSLEHPNILTCEGLFYIKDESKYQLVTTFCQNGNLFKNIEIINKKDTAFKMNVCLQICQGIQALHDKNIMHRDISAGNILFDSEWKVKICDFGFSKPDNDVRQSSSVGTPAFRDPNISSGKYSKKCDIFSAGMVMDFIFRGHTILSTCPDIESQKIQFLQFIRNKQKIINDSNAPKQLKTIILHCLESQQNQRLSSKQLVSEMKRVMKILKCLPRENQGQNTIIQFISEMNSTEEEKARQKRRAQNMFILENTEGEMMVKSSNPVENQANQKNQTFSIDILSKSECFISPIDISSIIMEPEQIILEKQNNCQSSFCAQQFCVKLMNAQKENKTAIKKIHNFERVFKFYLSRKKQMRLIDKVCDHEDINNQNKRVIIFLFLFTYLRFLKNHRIFLQNEEHNIIRSVNSIKWEQMNQKTRDICLQIIQKQILSAERAIKSFMLELYAQRNYWRQTITKSILQMINECKEKRYFEIQKFSRNVCEKQINQALDCSRFQKMNESLKELREKLLELSGMILQ